jgi:hypothetical protein
MFTDIFRRGPAMGAERIRRAVFVARSCVTALSWLKSGVAPQCFAVHGDRSA